MRKSITSRYFTTMAATLTCGVVLLSIIFFLYVRQYFTVTNIEKMREMSDVVSIFIENIESDNDDASLNQITESFVQQAGRYVSAEIFITDENGKLEAYSDFDKCGFSKSVVPEKELKKAMQHGQDEIVGTMSGFYTAPHYTAIRAIYNSDNEIKHFVFATTDTSGLTEYLVEVSAIFFVSIGIMISIASVLAIFLTTRMTSPLKRVSEAVDSFGKGDFTARVEIEDSYDSEFAQLAQTFNDMATSLEAIDKNRQRFMGDIAHELRTPMTTIKGFVDGIIDGVIPEEKYNHYLGIVSQESGRLTRLISGMMDANTVQAGEYILNSENYDVWDTITATLFGMEKRFETKRIGIIGFVPMKTIINADKDVVYQIIYNIVDNAVKFTNEGGEITLDVRENAEFVYVSIKNTGQGISKDALALIFERFYKEDASRGVHAGGSGLGMHICKMLANRIGGEISVESVESEYAQFTVKLPKGEKDLAVNKRKK